MGRKRRKRRRGDARETQERRRWRRRGRRGDAELITNSINTRRYEATLKMIIHSNDGDVVGVV